MRLTFARSPAAHLRVVPVQDQAVAGQQVGRLVHVVQGHLGCGQTRLPALPAAGPADGEQAADVQRDLVPRRGHRRRRQQQQQAAAACLHPSDAPSGVLSLPPLSPLTVSTDCLRSLPPLTAFGADSRIDPRM